MVIHGNLIHGQCVFSISGVDDFFGSKKLVNFLPGEREKSFSVIARVDNIPEVCLGTLY